MRKNSAIKATAAVLGMLLGSTPGLAPAAVPPRTGTNRVLTHVTTASWYGKEFARRRTASGELFNPMDLTAAHKTIPLGTRVRVTNLRNGRSVVVRITDRGPYHEGRGIDVSHEAARRLRMVDQGIAKVKLEQLPLTRESAPVATANAAWPSALGGARALSM